MSSNSCSEPSTTNASIPNRLPQRVLPTTIVTTDGVGDDRDALLAARDSVPNGTDLVSSPISATCYSCHASLPAEAHMEQNGGIIAEPRDASAL